MSAPHPSTSPDPDPDPAPVRPAARPGRGGAERLAWAVAVTPVLLLVLVTLLVPRGMPTTAATVLGAAVSWLVAVLLARADGRRRSGTGERPTAAGWAVLPWLHLGLRATRRRPGGAAAWLPAMAAVAVWLFALAVLAPLLDGLRPGGPYDRARMQAELSTGIRGRTGLAVTVRCPADPPVRQGSSFRCTVAGAGGSTSVEVLVGDDAGHYTWRLD